jgi:hypothetical protein
MDRPLASFAEFWPFYLRAHSRPGTRATHYTGTCLALLSLALAVTRLDWRFLVAAPLVGYAFAWLAHGVFERNRPATFGHPVWSLRADFLMLFLWATGRLEPELSRAAAAR